MKAIAPKIQDATADFYPTSFKNLNAGVTYTLESFPGMYRKTLFKMKGLFSENELKFIVDIFKATMLTPGLAGEHLAGNVQDSIELEFIDKKWDVEKEEILQKISKLRLFERSCLEIWAKSFWYNAGERKDLNTWIKILLKGK